MKNLIRNTTELAMHIVSQYIEAGDVVVDATCGNGKDTVSLARLCPGKVFAFDVQASAIENTRQALQQEALFGETIFLIRDSHENIGNYIKEEIKAAVFNLGYLPSASKEIITVESSTLKAIGACLQLLKKGGIICITMYDGHAGGWVEKNAVLQMAQALDEKKYHVVYLNMLNQKNHPPETVLITLK